MRDVRGWMKLFMAFVFVAFAMPGLAQPAKIYGLKMSPTALPLGGVGLVVTATFKNEVPNGNSSFNSLVLVAPAGLTIPAQTITTPSGSAVIVGNTIRVSNISPVKPQKSFEFTFTVNVVATTCTSDNWGSTVYAGSNFSGETFAIQPSPLSSIVALVGCDGALACSPSSPYTEGTTTITRDVDNPDKAPPICQSVPFNIILSDSDRLVLIQWDENVAPEVVLKAETEWPVENLTSTQWPKRTRVAWAVDNANAPVLIDAPACLLSGTDSPGLVGMDNVFPMVTVPPEYGASPQRARACIYDEQFQVQTASACTGVAAFGCIKVKTKMWISGDPWLSRQ